MNPNDRLKEIKKSLEKFRIKEYSDPVCDIDWLIARVEKLIGALEFYANKDNWKDVWKEEGHESSHFKYFYMLRQRTDDFERFNEPDYHYYVGKRARKALEEE